MPLLLIAASGGGMRTVWWALVAYSALVGISEIVDSAGASIPGASTLANFPSAGNLISPGNYTGGIIDLAAAAGIYFLVLHDGKFMH